MQKSSFSLKYALLAASMLIGTGGVALAEPAGEPGQVKGKVALYALNPHGAVDGLILTDGTEVRFPPRASNALVFAVKPGDAVTIRGLKSATVPGVTALVVTNDATGTVVETGPPGPPQQIEAESRIRLQLHDREGHLNGVLLEDGTIVRLPPAEAERHTAALAVGQPFFVRGDGRTGPLGKVIGAREIGPNRTTLSEVDHNRFERWMHEVFGGGEEAAAPAPAAPLAAGAAPAPAAPKLP